MPSQPYPTRNYAVAELLLTLRSRAKLTQFQLAQRLGVNQRSVQKWESGETYPTAKNLRVLIALLLPLGVFTPSQERDEAANLWQQVRQDSPQHLPLFDSAWFEQLLSIHSAGDITIPRSPTAAPAPLSAGTLLPASEWQPTPGDRKVATNLPYAAAPFVNRVSEIAEITHRLNDTGCRLLTLVGPGGIGKTRLAIRVARDCAEHFDDGVYFVPLQSLDSSEFIVSTVADAVGFQFRPGEEPQQQLLHYLREKALLLVLDNYEHLLDGAELLTELLQAAPEIKLLVTSREVLNLQEEWLYPVRGLHFPETKDVEQPGAYSAVQLFVERARQVRGELTLAAEQAAVIRVCQLVEGMPLALELAAGWTKTLSTDEVATEIQHNLDFLSTSLRNVPQRHQSITAVFEQTWQRLTDEERRVFRALSVFSGGFRREAAQAVAGVSMRGLSELVDKSLLTREPNGRYQIHELLRQYGEARLKTMPDEKKRIHDLHSAYYARFLTERNKDVNSHRQREVFLEIKAELDNIRAAWSWAVEHSRVEEIEQAQYALFWFYAIQSRSREGMGAFEKAAQMLDIEILDSGDLRREILLSRVLASLGWLCVRAGALEQAQAVLERSCVLQSKHAFLSPPGVGADPRLMLAFVYIVLGSNLNAAEELGQEALRNYTLREDHHNLAYAYCVLAYVSRAHGNYQEARDYAQQGYSQTVISGDESFGSYCLLEWSLASQFLGDMEDAKRRLRAAYAVVKELGDPTGMADMLNSLGRLALLEGDNAEARRCYEQARTISHDLGDHPALAAALEGIGNSALVLGHYGEAQRYLCEALQVTNDRIPPRILSILVGVGELFLQTGKHARGIELLAFALHQSPTNQDTKERARRLLSRYQATTETMPHSSPETDFEAITTTLLNELQIPEERTLTRHTSQAGETLIEPLSERELAILTLIADRLSNREVADKLSLSVGTVKWYLTHIYGKLGVEGRALAILRARELNLLP